MRGFRVQNIINQKSKTMNKKYTYVYMNTSNGRIISIPNLSVVKAAGMFFKAMESHSVKQHHESGESIYYKTQTLFIAVIQQMEA